MQYNAPRMHNLKQSIATITLPNISVVPNEKGNNKQQEWKQ